MFLNLHQFPTMYKVETMDENRIDVEGKQTGKSNPFSAFGTIYIPQETYLLHIFI